MDKSGEDQRPSHHHNLKQFEWIPTWVIGSETIKTEHFTENLQNGACLK